MKVMDLMGMHISGSLPGRILGRASSIDVGGVLGWHFA